jgi:hypothetical protein
VTSWRKPFTNGAKWRRLAGKSPEMPIIHGKFSTGAAGDAFCVVNPA